MKCSKILILMFILTSCVNKKKEPNKRYNRDIVYCSAVTDSLLVYSTWNKKKIVVENIFTKRILFERKLTDICYLIPVLIEGYLYYPNSNNEFVCCNVKKNEIIWKLRTEYKVNNVQVLDGNKIILNIINAIIKYK